MHVTNVTICDYTDQDLSELFSLIPQYHICAVPYVGAVYGLVLCFCGG